MSLSAEVLAVGKYVRATDPGMIERLAEWGEPTNARAIGKYVLSADPEMFDHILEITEKED